VGSPLFNWCLLFYMEFSSLLTIIPRPGPPGTVVHLGSDLQVKAEVVKALGLIVITIILYSLTSALSALVCASGYSVGLSIPPF